MSKVYFINGVNNSVLKQDQLTLLHKIYGNNTCHCPNDTLNEDIIKQLVSVLTDGKGVGDIKTTVLTLIKNIKKTSKKKCLFACCCATGTVVLCAAALHVYAKKKDTISKELVLQLIRDLLVEQAQPIAVLLKEMILEDKSSNITLVAHSHGGMVVNELLKLKDEVDWKKKIVNIQVFGCPIDIDSSDIKTNVYTHEHDPIVRLFSPTKTTTIKPTESADPNPGLFYLHSWTTYLSTYLMLGLNM